MPINMLIRKGKKNMYVFIGATAVTEEAIT